jgi:hypothetical protein
MRTLKRDETYNDTTKAYMFPQTPSRIQLSLWPAGLPSNGKGTIEWAGGLVNWDSQYMQNGYYYAMVNDVQVECYDPPSGKGSGDTYYYTDVAATESDVNIGNNNTILASFMASGEKPDFDPNAKQPTGSSSTSSAPVMTATPESVPGISGGGNVASSGKAPVDTGNDEGSSGSSGGSGSSDSAGPMGGSSSFSQGGGSGGSGGGTSQAPRVVAGSAVALLGFFVAALLL